LRCTSSRASIKVDGYPNLPPLMIRALGALHGPLWEFPRHDRSPDAGEKRSTAPLVAVELGASLARGGVDNNLPRRSVVGFAKSLRNRSEESIMVLHRLATVIVAVTVLMGLP